jgi:hypothetical protein
VLSNTLFELTVANLHKGKRKGYRWHPDVIHLFSTLVFRAGQGVLSHFKGFVVPSLATVRRELR